MTREQAQALYDEWKNSGQTQRCFLAHKGLKETVFNSHYKTLVTKSPRKKQKEHGSLQMLPVKLGALGQGQWPLPRARESTHQELTLQFMCGHSLRFPVDTSVEYLSRLIGAMESRHTC